MRATSGCALTPTLSRLRRAREMKYLKLHPLKDHFRHASNHAHYPSPESRLMPPGAFRRWNFSTSIHQIFSVLRQTGGLTLTDLFEQLCQNGAFCGIARRDFLLLLRNLKDKALLDQMTSGENERSSAFV